MIRHAWLSVSCLLMMSSLRLLVIDAARHESDATEIVSSYADFARSRQRRSCSEPYTMSNFIRLIKKFENNNLSIPTKRVAAYLRGLAYNSLTWRLSCGKTETELKTGLTVAEVELLKVMIGHSSNSTTGLETGVLLTRDGTVAVGHVITGIDCGGFNRDTQVTIAGIIGLTSDIDNLFQATISGDIGQTTLLHYAYPKLFPLLGPSGSWDSSSCPRVYSMNPKAASELTNSEILGDMDGAILGTVIPLIKDKPLSEILQEYYEGSGISTGGRIFKASDNVATFGELISNHELEAQSVSFTEAFYNSKQILSPFKRIYNGTSRTKLMKKVPSTVQTFFNKLYLSCPGVLMRKYTISYFIGLVKQLEQETSFDIKDMSFAILTASNYDFPTYLTKKANIASYSYTNSFASYVMREMVTHRFANNDKKRELGVIDADGEAVTIETVLAGVFVGATYKTKPSGEMTDYALSLLHKMTLAGSLAAAADRRDSAKRKSKEIMGMSGYWDNSRCPPEYRYRTIMKVGQHTTRPELLGGIDGFVLGKKLSTWLIAEGHLKLSFVLERYYGSGYKSVSSKGRLEHFNNVIVSKSDLFKRVKLSCRTNDCQQTAQDIANTFYKTMAKSTVNARTGSQFLPDYRTLVSVYPGDKTRGGVISGEDLLKKLTGNLRLDDVKTLAATDGLRVSSMLNQMDGHYIPQTQSQGAFIGTDKNVYIFDLAALKTYLTKTYKDPPETASSVATFKGQRGIMMVDVTQADGSAGSVGLWDGNKMHQITDVTKTTSVRTFTFWQTKGCASLAESGKCEFYNCVDNAFPCREDGYAVGYGYRYCSKFTEHYDKFTTEGKTWVDEVRKCLMKEIAPFFKGAHDCDTIKRIAFDSHVGCYLKSGIGFCKMAQDSSNWDALWAVYEMKDFAPGAADFAAAWKQVLDTGKYCVNDLSKSIFNNLLETIKGGYEKLKRSFQSSQEEETDVTSECIAYANAGDCRFYGCFQQRFPCDVFGSNHITDFELQLCEDFNTQNTYFDSQGRQWTKATNKCLMQKLLPLYRQASVMCIDLHAVMFRDRVDCLVDSGFCGVTYSTHNRWAIDRATDLSSYPALLPDKAGLSVAGREYFYRELSSFRRLMGYTNFACYAKGLKEHNTFYVRVRTESGYRLMEQN